MVLEFLEMAKISENNRANDNRFYKKSHVYKKKKLWNLGPDEVQI